MNFFRFSKIMLIFMTISFAIFVFGSIGIYRRVVRLVNVRKISKVCFLLVVVFLVCFSLIKLLVFPVFFPLSFFHLTDHLVDCNGMLSLHRK